MVPSVAKARGGRRFFSAVPSQQNVEVPCTVQHAVDVHAVLQWFVEDDILPDGETPHAGSQLVAGSSKVGVQGKHPDCGIDFIEKTVGCRGIIKRDIRPDRHKIGSSRS
mgnify:CR=1 FL=1